MKTPVLIILLSNCLPLLAQNVAINTDGSAPNASAMLDIKSSSRGILIPRTSTTSRLAIINPANGLMLYDTTLGSFWFNHSGVWIESGRFDPLKQNTFFGYHSGNNIPTGSFNCGIGHDAFYSNTTGSSNTALGFESLFDNTTGSGNIALGYRALRNSTTGGGNVAIGMQSLINNTGNYNIGIGVNSLDGPDGDFNIGIGYATICEGGRGTALGYNAKVNGNIQYATAVGALAAVTCSNCLVLGGYDAASRTKVGINTPSPASDLHIIQQGDNNFDNTRGIRLSRANGNQWRTFIDPSNDYVFQYNNGVFAYIEPVGGTFISSSDERLKKDILPLDGTLAKLMQLQPKTYHFISSDDPRRSFGFLAQEVEKLFPEFVFTSEAGLKGISYSNLSVIAIKAIQEQQQQLQQEEKEKETLKKLVLQQQEKINELSKRMEALEKAVMK